MDYKTLIRSAGFATELEELAQALYQQGSTIPNAWIQAFDLLLIKYGFTVTTSPSKPTLRRIK